MVNEAGQLYTIEGLAAGALIIITAYLVMNATTILTPSDTHVADMQLAQLGNDVLRMMDTPNNISALSLDENNLANWIVYNNTTSKNDFREEFTDYWPPEKAPGVPDQVNFIAKVYYSASGKNYTFCKSSDETQYLRENAVTVTRWVTVDNSDGSINPTLDSGIQTVLLEVLIWRD